MKLYTLIMAVSDRRETPQADLRKKVLHETLWQSIKREVTGKPNVIQLMRQHVVEIEESAPKPSRSVVYCTVV
eukprot:m.361451 g.361451  ORF g.361451 m.361451 type:complete len:73 (+) comp19598_c0_seq1:748-966(+)